MHNVSLKVKLAVYLVGGLIFYISGCSMPRPLPAVEGTSGSQHQAETRPTPTPASKEIVVSAPTLTPTSVPATATLAPTLTPTVAALPIPTPEHGPFSYHTITEGQTLSYIALFYQTEIEDLIRLNELDGASTLIQIGQVLRVPLQTDSIAPSEILIPDSEVVYSPAYVDFDVAEFVDRQGGYLATYHEVVEGEQLSGAEIVVQVAEQFSVGPRLLLTLLDHYGGWVTNPNPTEEQLSRPLGPKNPRIDSLHLALGFTANRINAGYYGYKRDGFWVFHLPDRSQVISAVGINAGTVGLQNILAIHSDFETWQLELSAEGLMADYRALFGDPFAKEFRPLVPINLSQPAMSLPWAKTQGFYFTSGPHGGFADGSGWAAIDFGPPDVLGNCFYSREPTIAVAPGVVVVARQGEVQIDLDGDGNIQTGWVLLYLHVALDFGEPLQIGQLIARGDIIGYASCEGGLANSSHLHFARRYNGEWIEAGGPIPLNLSGWVVQPNTTPYEGLIIQDDQVRSSCECWDAEKNLIVNQDDQD